MQKKILSVLFLASLLAVQFLPAMALAQVTPPPLPDYCMIRADPARIGIDGCGAVGSECHYVDNPQCGMCCVLSSVLYMTDWIFIFLVVLVIAFVLMGAYEILTAAGSADKINKGRDYIMYAAIGLAIALLAKAIPAIVKFLIAPTV